MCKRDIKSQNRNRRNKIISAKGKGVNMYTSDETTKYIAKKKITNLKLPSYVMEVLGVS